MQKTYDGNFGECHIENTIQGMKYKYRIYSKSGKYIDHCDPYGFYSDLRPETASIIYGLSNYTFHDTAYLKQLKDSENTPMNIYEIHAGSWKKPIDEIEYPCDESWGYQATGFFSPTSRYGNPDDLRYFIDKCHWEDIGVLLDFVPVHFALNDYALLNYDGTSIYEYPHSDIAFNEWGSCNFMHSRGEVGSFLQSKKCPKPA